MCHSSCSVIHFTRTSFSGCTNLNFPFMVLYMDNHFLFQIIQRFVIVDLSNFYFDVAKDRLYVG
uniref:IsoleucinetRNA ligaseic/mitochondrial n=2 Tax=Rhizophora mucronata TaxID=61149 RepID=A0A2P2LMX3_RHIMU